MDRKVWLFALASALGCGDPLAVDLPSQLDGTATPELGVLRYHEYPERIEIPEIAIRGAPFEVVIRTYGGGCTRQGSIEVTDTDYALVLIPIDTVITSSEPNVVCAAVLSGFDHRLELRLNTSGTRRIHVIGRISPSDKIIHRDFVIRVVG